MAGLPSPHGGRLLPWRWLPPGPVAPSVGAGPGDAGFFGLAQGLILDCQETGDLELLMTQTWVTWPGMPAYRSQT